MTEYLCKTPIPARLSPAPATTHPLSGGARPDSLRVGIVGARGYSGLELVRLLLQHPAVRNVDCYYQNEQWETQDYFPKTRSVQNRLRSKIRMLPMPKDPVNLKNESPHDFVFLATPPEASLEWAPFFLNAGVPVIDLSHAFRFKPESAFYGLSPWQSCFQAGTLKNPVLVANPGCYATSVLMAMIPLLPLLEPESIVIDAKSGTTGAGKKPLEHLLFSEVDGECLPYRVGQHQHIPEVVQALQSVHNVRLQPFWTTHLLNTRRGILTSIYAKTRSHVTAQDIQSALDRAYANYPLVNAEALPPSDDANTRAALSLKNITGTPDTVIRYRLIGDQLYCFSLIDNLLKGAASQAVENMNALMGLPLTCGLEPAGWKTESEAEAWP